jgi:hypothetical protein
MASISFEVLDSSTVVGLNGSGLGFYGSTFGASVPTQQYQRTTFVTNGDGTIDGGECRNVRYMGSSATPNATGCFRGLGQVSGTLVNTNASEATLIIHFKHNIPVKVQNAQLRIYDRSANVDAPASGVITKVAEMVNFNSQTFNDWNNSAGSETTSVNAAYGDAFWWGAPWPSGAMYASADSSFRPYYVNSVGTIFKNYTDYQYFRGSGNPDSAISGLLAPAFETVGGSGIVVPLLDSPGSGGRLLWTGVIVDLVPKYTQYVKPTYQTGSLGKTTAVDSGIGSNLLNSYGGTGYDGQHSWRVALSASPLSIGSKTNYALYVSLEYL